MGLSKQQDQEHHTLVVVGMVEHLGKDTLVVEWGMVEHPVEWGMVEHPVEKGMAEHPVERGMAEVLEPF